MDYSALQQGLVLLFYIAFCRVGVCRLFPSSWGLGLQRIINNERCLVQSQKNPRYRVTPVSQKYCMLRRICNSRGLIFNSHKIN